MKFDTVTFVTPGLMDLLLPPSVNKLYFTQKNSQKKVLHDDVRNYLEIYSLKIKGELRKIGHKPIDRLFYLDLNWYLPNKNMDSHNLKKVLFDCLQKAVFVQNDKYIMDRTQSIQYDNVNPRVRLQWK